MEVMPSSPEFHFTTASAAASAAAGEPFNYHQHYSSAPTSPTRASAVYSHFSFSFSFNSGEPPAISTADELFEKGKIRPLHHPPPPNSGERGRQKTSPVSDSENRARQSRSLSPLRNHSFFIKNASKTGRKWRLKDFLLFRSASEGRATGRGSRDPLRKYTLLSSFSSFSSKCKKKEEEEEEEEEDVKCGSFRSTESCGGKGRGASAHEIHYTENRAAAGEKRKKTPLPYQRQGLFSCLQFNPALRSISKGFTGFSSSMGR